MVPGWGHTSGVTDMQELDTPYKQRQTSTLPLTEIAKAIEAEASAKRHVNQLRHIRMLSEILTASILNLKEGLNENL